MSVEKSAATGVSMTGKFDMSAATMTAAIRGAATVTTAAGQVRRHTLSSVIAAGVAGAIN